MARTQQDKGAPEYHYFVPYLHTSIILFCLPLLQLSTPVAIAQKTTVGFKGNGKLHGPSRARVTTESQWIQESLEYHNMLRSLHGSPPLILNNTLNEISQYYADHLLRTNINVLEGQAGGKIFFEHNPETGRAKIGENLFYTVMTRQVKPIPASYAVLLWYEEIKDYDFSTASRKPSSDPTAQIGHLTQLLWKSTSQMGTAYASRKLPNNKVVEFVVANYFRQGNLILTGNEKKLYLENVLPSSLSTADINAVIVSSSVKSWWKEPEPKASTPESWINSALKIHNHYRRIHDSQPLRLNKDMCKVSQLWANYLVQKGLQDMNLYRVHPQLEPNFVATQLCNFGETSVWFVTPDDNDISVQNVLKSWYNQSRQYEYAGRASRGGQNINTDDFEQMVWNSTTEFCMTYARKKAENGQYLTYVTAYYYPSVTDEEIDRKQNVFPPSANADEEYDSDNESTSSVGTIFLVIFVTALLVFMSVVGSMFLLFKFKLSWYESVMKTVKLRR